MQGLWSTRHYTHTVLRWNHSHQNLSSPQDQLKTDRWKKKLKVASWSVSRASSDLTIIKKWLFVHQKSEKHTKISEESKMTFYPNDKCEALTQYEQRLTFNAVNQFCLENCNIWNVGCVQSQLEDIITVIEVCEQCALHTVCRLSNKHFVSQCIKANLSRLCVTRRKAAISDIM